MLPSGRWFSWQEAQEEFILRGETQMQIDLSLETGVPKPTLTQVAPFQTQEDTPLLISHAALLAASDAADPQGLAIRFRIERFASGRLSKNGVPVAALSTLLGPGESLLWTPPLNQNDANFPALVVRAHTGQSSSVNAVTVRVNLAAAPDAPRADNHAYTLSEDGQISFELVVDAPDGGAVPSVVITVPPPMAR
ncbi:MAG: hypothetical protein SGI99_07190 [Pseudomonadota bacterium]|nr:hypothetical protein [Pseudomonadota bacterium]